MSNGAEDRSPPQPGPAGDRLRAAFRQHGASTGRQWSVTVRRLRMPAGQEDRAAETPCVRVELTGADAEALADVLHAAAELATGPGRRGANWAWIGSAETARIVGVEPSTIRAWVAGRGPGKHPFPRPGVKIPGRNLWRRRTVERWKAEHDAHQHDQPRP